MCERQAQQEEYYFKIKDGKLNGHIHKNGHTQKETNCESTGADG